LSKKTNCETQKYIVKNNYETILLYTTIVTLHFLKTVLHFANLHFEMDLHFEFTFLNLQFEFTFRNGRHFCERHFDIGDIIVRDILTQTTLLCATF